LSSTLASAFPDVSIGDVSAGGDCLEAAASELSETEYEADLNTLEISQLLKRKKRPLAAEHESSGLEEKPEQVKT
jgi:hypothetical protein